MNIIRISFSDDDWAELQKLANEHRMTVHDYIRHTLFRKKTIFTPQEAERRAVALFNPGEEFSLSDLYSDEEWGKISCCGGGGVFGKRFFGYVANNSTKIKFSRTLNRRARYRIL